MSPTVGLFAGHQIHLPEIERVIKAKSDLLEAVDRDVYELELLLYHGSGEIMKTFCGGNSKLPWGIMKTAAYGSVNTGTNIRKRIRVQRRPGLSDSEVALLVKTPRGTQILEESKDILLGNQLSKLKTLAVDSSAKTEKNADSHSEIQRELELSDDQEQSSVTSSEESQGDVSASQAVLNFRNAEEKLETYSQSRSDSGNSVDDQVPRKNTSNDRTMGLATAHEANLKIIESEALMRLAKHFNSEDENQGFENQLTRADLDTFCRSLMESCQSAHFAIIDKGMFSTPKETVYQQLHAARVSLDRETFQETFKLVVQNRALFYSLQPKHLRR